MTATTSPATLHPLRGAADVPQHPLLHLLARLPAADVPADRRAQPERVDRRHHLRHLLHDRHGGVGVDDGGHGRRRPHRRRAVGRLEPPAAHHALRTPAYFSAKVVTGYLMALCSIAILYTAGIALGVSMSAMNWLQMTGADPGRADPVRRHGRAARPPAHGRLDGPCARRPDGAVRLPRRQLGPARSRARSGSSPSCCRRTGWCRPARSASAHRRGRPRRGS